MFKGFNDSNALDKILLCLRVKTQIHLRRRARLGRSLNLFITKSGLGLVSFFFKYLHFIAKTKFQWRQYLIDDSGYIFIAIFRSH